MVRMLEHVAAAIHTRALAVPHREHAVAGRVGVHVDPLRAPDRRGGEVLVQSRLELDARALEKLRGAPELLVEPTQWRSAVPGHESRGVEPRELVALALQHQQPHERLHAGQIDPAGFKLVFIVESNVAQRGCAGGGGCHRNFSKIVFWMPRDQVYGTPNARGGDCVAPSARCAFYALDRSAAIAFAYAATRLASERDHLDVDDKHRRRRFAGADEGPGHR